MPASARVHSALSRSAAMELLGGGRKRGGCLDGVGLQLALPRRRILSRNWFRSGHYDRSVMVTPKVQLCFSHNTVCIHLFLARDSALYCAACIKVLSAYASITHPWFELSLYMKTSIRHLHAFFLSDLFFFIISETIWRPNLHIAQATNTKTKKLSSINNRTNMAVAVVRPLIPSPANSCSIPAAINSPPLVINPSQYQFKLVDPMIKDWLWMVGIIFPPN
jgi:hypothetical protein